MRERKIIWFALFVSTFIYAVIVYSLSRSWPQPGAFAATVQRPLILGLYAAAVVMFAMALILPRSITDERTRFINTLALFESCSVLGLTAAFLVQDWRVFIAPWALSLIGFMRSFPSGVR